VGGLVSALDPLLRQTGGTWVAWDDGFREGDPLGSRVRVPLDAPEYVFRRLRLTEQDLKLFYQGFSNRTLWPLCHYFLGRCEFVDRHFERYQEVNVRFAEAVGEEARPGDTIFVQDYHLALVPTEIRRLGMRVRIAFFWHIPFPPWDVFRILPWREEILKGMLDADLIGFHTRSYVRHFAGCAVRLFGAKWDEAAETLHVGDRSIRVRACPLGIEYEEFERLALLPQTRDRARGIRKALDTPIIILGADRVDYSKGIIERLAGVERFLELYPEYRRRISFIQIAVPSRAEVPEYKTIIRAIDETVGRINGRFAEEGWAPIHYYARAFPRQHLAAYYLASDIALLTPLRDGLNLISKEYAACKPGEDGTLILSEFAGASDELEDALLVNPYDVDDVAKKLKIAAEMPAEERRRHMRRLRDHTATHDIGWWRNEFLGEFLRTGQFPGVPPGRRVI
jgi:trehalose 6-phosphate synthase